MSKDGTGGQVQVLCTCVKSKCLKLYCECFASGQLCNDQCKCLECKNREDTRLPDNRDIPGNQAASKSESVPSQSTKRGERAVRNQCSCRRSSCTKKYCECFNACTTCNANCRCYNCMNSEHPRISNQRTHDWKMEGMKVTKSAVGCTSMLDMSECVTAMPSPIGGMSVQPDSQPGTSNVYAQESSRAGFPGEQSSHLRGDLASKPLTVGSVLDDWDIGIDEAWAIGVQEPSCDDVLDFRTDEQLAVVLATHSQFEPNQRHRNQTGSDPGQPQTQLSPRETLLNQSCSNSTSPGCAAMAGLCFQSGDRDTHQLKRRTRQRPSTPAGRFEPTRFPAFAAPWNAPMDETKSSNMQVLQESQQGQGEEERHSKMVRTEHSPDKQRRGSVACIRNQPPPIRRRRQSLGESKPLEEDQLKLVHELQTLPETM
jgi:hypothetical protein